MTVKKGRVFSGARPTGRQHLGNYLGAIKNYVALQDEYECIYCIVDLHALTTLETTKSLKSNTYEMALDWLAAGLRPEETIIFIQSHVPEVTELHTILSMVVGLGKLTDLPTFKEKARQQPHNINYGLADGVQKMSKSLDKHLELAATPEETTARVMTMVTDPQRKRRSDPGDPDVCNVFTMHKIFSTEADVKEINIECRRAGIGCVDCKKRFAQNLNAHLAPFREKRSGLSENPDQVWNILVDGAARAGQVTAL
ncbi:MAG: tryptophan--tRNA ligase [Anaerolineales bacterium]